MPIRTFDFSFSNPDADISYLGYTLVTQFEEDHETGNTDLQDAVRILTETAEQYRQQSLEIEYLARLLSLCPVDSPILLSRAHDALQVVGPDSILARHPGLHLVYLSAEYEPEYLDADGRVVNTP